MGLRADLVHQLTPELLLKGMMANQHRYKPEPLLAKTGVGSLAPATSEDVRRERRIRKSINKVILKAGNAEKS